ncbi:zinc metalloproteinase nas-13-like [Uranotaenia lowii]|uniref:zinc metalloproteinase nas-13-like n=1 Tax=Uranotaenia lowii TaxID=190385 RepID=UPI002478CF50|nr:zinc metalloproteinase nas-13-like [Uranotaenia lowii]
MKKILQILLLLALLAALANATYYHAFEELGRKDEGDVIVRYEPDLTQGSNRKTLKWWPNGIVKYEISDSISPEDQQIILSAMDAIMEVSKVKFTPKVATDRDYVAIINTDVGCWASLGYHGGRQELNLDPRGCMDKGAILHQLMHTLGFIHPSNRADRNLYVDVDLSNVNAFNHGQFQPVDPTLYNDFGLTYDYESILHRGGKAFTNNGKDTIKPLHGDFELGQRDKLSYKDVKMLNKMYP